MNPETKAAELSDEDLDEFIRNHEKPLVIMFTARWCEVCQKVEPLIQEMSNRYNDMVDFVELDADQFPNATFRRGVLTLPTLLFFKDGRQIHRTTGEMNEEELDSAIQEVIAEGG